MAENNADEAVDVLEDIVEEGISGEQGGSGFLSGLLTGYYSVGEVACREGASVPPELAPVLNILFPSGHPFVYQGDNY